MSEDEQRRSELPRDVAEDNHILDKLRSRKEKAGSLPERPKGKHKCNETAMGE